MKSGTLTPFPKQELAKTLLHSSDLEDLKTKGYSAASTQSDDSGSLPSDWSFDPADLNGSLIQFPVDRQDESSEETP